MKGLDDQPPLGELAVLYFQAWSALSTSRNSAGFSVGAIPYETITAWGRDHGIEDLDDLERLVWGVQAIDVDFIARVQKKDDNGGAKAR